MIQNHPKIILTSSKHQSKSIQIHLSPPNPIESSSFPHPSRCPLSAAGAPRVRSADPPRAAAPPRSASPSAAAAADAALPGAM